MKKTPQNKIADKCAEYYMCAEMRKNAFVTTGTRNTKSKI